MGLFVFYRKQKLTYIRGFYTKQIRGEILDSILDYNYLILSDSSPTRFVSCQLRVEKIFP